MSGASSNLSQALSCVDSSWSPLFEDQLEHLNSLFANLDTQLEIGSLAPPIESVFRVFETPVHEIRVLILGQDPYPTPDVATGRAFATCGGTKPPASFRNIEVELQTSLVSDRKLDSTLETWADQGVFLLNTALTIDLSQPRKGHFRFWEMFTIATLDFISQNSPQHVWLLWGTKAGAYEQYAGHNIVLKTTHPSPLSAYRGFSGSNIFVSCNEELQQLGLKPIDWLATC
jgi:uracil-DNA glycosylase